MRGDGMDNFIEGLQILLPLAIFLGAFSAFFAVMGWLLTWALKPIDDKLGNHITDTNKKIDNLTSHFNDMKSYVNDLKSNFSDMRSDVNDLKSNFKRMEGKFDQFISKDRNLTL